MSDGADRPLRRLLELLALTGLALAQPVLSAFSDSPETFVSHEAGRTTIVLFALIVAFAPAAVLFAVEVLVGLVRPSLARTLHLVFVAALVCGVAVHVVDGMTELGWQPLLAIGAVLGVLGALLVAKVDLVRVWLRFLAVAPFAFVLLFLVASPVSEVAFGSRAGGGDGVRAGRPANVVMIVLDELPTASLLDESGAIEEEAFPNLARLAADGTWYRNHTTVAADTTLAVPAIMSGTYEPTASPAPVVSEYPDNLFTLLDDTYRVQATEVATGLCPDTCASGASRSGAEQLGGLLSEAGDVLEDVVVPRSETRTSRGIFQSIEEASRNAVPTFEEFLPSLGAEPQPRLDFLHLMLPHTPWRYLPSGGAYPEPEVTPGLGVGVWSGNAPTITARQRHLLQLGYADALVGRVLDRLEELGTYDESLVVVTADHGVAFTAGEPVRTISERNYPEILWTPLLIKAPGQEDGAVDDTPARSTDILPTIADHLDVEVPWELQGSSLLGSRDGVDDTVRAPYHPPPDWDEPGFAEWRALAAKPEPGADDLAFDRGTGFAAVLDGGPFNTAAPADLRLYGLGRYGGLVGRPASELPVAAGGRSGTLRDPDALADADEGALDGAALVDGELEGGDQVPVAISVNGRIAAWADAVAGDDGRVRFQLVVPPALLRPGGNDVDVYVVEGPEDAPRLAPVTLG